MNFNNSFLNNILQYFQVDYTQMEIPFIKDILNTELFGFYQLNYNLRIIILLVLFIVIVNLVSKISNSILYRLKKIYNFLKIKYKNATEKRFNTLISTQINKKMSKVTQFILVCHFENIEENKSKLHIFNDFIKAFLINQEAKVKYDQNSIVFKFEDFYKTINGIATQLYLTKEVFQKKYPELKIYTSGINIEDGNNYEAQIDKIMDINRLKISNKFIVCDTSLKFYYNLVNPKLYEFESKGEYLLQNHTIELYTMIPPVDRTL